MGKWSGNIETRRSAPKARREYSTYREEPAFGSSPEKKELALERAQGILTRRADPQVCLTWECGGIPVELQGIQGLVLVSRGSALPHHAARQAALELVEATPVNADLRGVWESWLHWALCDAPHNPCDVLMSCGYSEHAQLAADIIQRGLAGTDPEERRAARDQLSARLQAVPVNNTNLLLYRSLLVLGRAVSFHPGATEAYEMAGWVRGAGVSAEDAVERLRLQLSECPQWVWERSA